MKLTKTVMALAIAGIAATPMMASATTTLSGAVQLRFSGGDDGLKCDTTLAADDPANLTDPTDADTSLCISNTNGQVHDKDDAQITAGDVILAVGASQALNSGLTGYGNLRVDLDGTSGSAIGAADEVYVGVKGGFGHLRMGEVANAGEYGQMIDLHDMGIDVNEGIGYTGSFGGATVGLTYSPAPDHDMLGVGAKFGWNGLSLGVGMQNLDEKTNISAGVGFAFAGASIAVDFGSEGEAIPAVVDAAGVQTASAKDETHIGVSVGYAIAGVSMTLKYDAEQESEQKKIRFDASYALWSGAFWF